MLAFSNITLYRDKTNCVSMNSKSALLVQRWMLQPRLLLVLILLQFIIQFFTSVYLYKYVTNVESDLRLVKSQYPSKTVALSRRRRSSALLTGEDNAVSDISSRVRIKYICNSYMYIKYVYSYVYIKICL